MSVEELKRDAVTELTRWQRHRFFGLIALVLVVSSILVAISLSLYSSSGAAQVDLSRPGYQTIQKQASQDRNETSYPASGELNKSAYDEFSALYNKHLGRIESNLYNTEPLGEDALQLLGGASADQPAN